MGQKVRPTGFRVGIYEDWRSRWYARKKDFGQLLVEDQKIRESVKREYGFAGVPRVDIERKTEGGEVTVIIRTARPGVIIGRKGAKVDKLKDDLAKITKKNVDLKIVEIDRPAGFERLLVQDKKLRFGYIKSKQQEDVFVILR